MTELLPRSDQDADHLIILVHGINTRALWMNEIRPALEDAGFAVAPTSYGRFGIPRFLFPGTWLRRKAVNRIAADIHTARAAFERTYGRPPAKMSVISHSFGTYVISIILRDHPELVWKRIIFCGSVVREDFDFDRALTQFTSPLLNEVGTKDYLPALAESVGWGYGSVGSTGFNRPPVETRWHHGLRHSDFLKAGFCNRHWVPFLRGERLSRGDAAQALPLGVRALVSLPLRWVLVAVALGGAFWLGRIGFEMHESWAWKVPSAGTLAERRSQLIKSAREPNAPIPPFLKLEGTWTLLTNNETVSFFTGPAGNMARFSYFGDAVAGPSIRDKANITVNGNGVRCFYDMRVQSAKKMYWELVATTKAFFKQPMANEECPPSTELRRTK